ATAPGATAKGAAATGSRRPPTAPGGPEPRPAGSVEEAGDRAVLEDRAHRPGDERRDGEDREVLELLAVDEREGVGDDDLLRGALLHPLDGRAGEDRVRRGDDHAGGAVGHERVG